MIKSEDKPTIIVISCIVIFFFSIIIFIDIMIVPTKSFNIKLIGENLNIKGKAPIQISLNNIKNIELLNKAPSIIFNGGGEAGNMIFGHNYMKNLGFTECYVNNANDKVIYIKTANNQFLIGLNNDVTTKDLYNKLLLYHSKKTLYN